MRIPSSILRPSSVVRGKQFEIQTRNTLMKKLFIEPSRISICGGAFDQGIDIRGSWNIMKSVQNDLKRLETLEKLEKKPPGQSLLAKGVSEVEILVQCKATLKKIPAKIVRELVGAYTRNVTSARQYHRVIGFLVLTMPLTADGMSLFLASPVPMVFLEMEEDGQVRGFLRNQTGKKLLRGLSLFEDIL